MKRLVLVLAFVGLAVNASAQNPFSLVNFGATPVDTNSGAKSAGTLRVVIATDQPQNTTAWLVTGLGGTFPVTGTFWQATQPVSIAASVAVTGTFFQATQPVSIADGSDVTLGAKADAKSTATDTTAVSIMSVLKQVSASVQAPPSQAVTNAGTFAVQNTQQGTASQNVAQVNGVTTQTGTGAAGTGTQRVAVASDSSIVLAAGSATIGALTANQSVNVAQINGVTTTMGNGASGTGVQRMTLASDSTGVVGLNAGTNTIGGVKLVAATASGTAPCFVSSAASTNATNCKGSAGLLYGLELVNTTSTLYYLRLYNLASAPTCSSATGFIRTIPIPHNTGAGGGVSANYTIGETYGTGIGFCLTGGGSSTDNTNAATGVYVTLQYN